MGEKLIRENDSEVRWRDYFVRLLNGIEINEVGVRRARSGENERIV